jgi:hypothetical protein
MRCAGPLNLRPYLDPKWFKTGGASHVCLAISYFWYPMPFMPLGKATNLKPGDPMPSFDDMFSRGRFIYRSKLLQRHAVRNLSHPMLIDIAAVRMPQRVSVAKEVAQVWTGSDSRSLPSEPPHLSPREQSDMGLVMAHGGSNFGNVSLAP